MQDEFPAEPVDAHLMMEFAQEHEVREPGGAALGFGHQVVDVAAGGGLSQPPGHAQCRSRKITARRMWSGILSEYPTSSGRLAVA
jgi:hypothetical protein